MTDRLHKEIQKARPRLKMYSPLAFWDVLVMSVFNLVLGISFMLAIDQSRVSAPLLIVNEIFSFKFWGIVFLLIGIMKVWALWSNNWELAKKTLLIGVSVKAAWMVALIIRTLVSPGTVFLALLWATVALLQIGAYVWFMPPTSGANYNQRKKDR